MNWISVSEKIPDCLSIQYIGQAETGSEQIRTESEQYKIVSAGMMDYRCKFWLPLPPPPETAREK